MADTTKPNPGITSANLPAPPMTAHQPTQANAGQAQAHKAEEYVVIDDADIKAKPLVGADFTNLRPQNPNHSLRWVNRAAGGGARYDTMKAQGFRNALVRDIAEDKKTGVRVPIHYQKDNAVINGDLILMLIDRVDYVGQLKLNEQRAMARLGRRAVAETGNKNMKEALNEVPGSAANKAKVSLYNPNI